MRTVTILCIQATIAVITTSPITMATNTVGIDGTTTIIMMMMMKINAWR